MNAVVTRNAGEGEADQDEYGVRFWVGAAIGWAIIVYGAVLLYGDDEANWFNTARLVVIGIIAHDVVWLIVSVGAGWLLRERSSATYRTGFGGRGGPARSWWRCGCRWRTDTATVSTTTRSFPATTPRRS